MFRTILKIDKCMVTINNVCSFPVLIIENKGKSQQRTKHAENLHKHAHAAILPNNALLAPNFCTKKECRLVLVNILGPFL